MSKQETIDFILEKVAPIFNKQGYIGTSLSDLTEATQLSKGSIYGNFENKEDLALKAFKYNARWVLKPLGDAIKDKKTGLSKLVAVVDYHRTYGERVQKIGGCPVLNVGIDAKHINPKLYQMAKEISTRLMNDLELILQLGVKDKSLISSTNTSLTAKNIYAMIDGGVFLTMTHNDATYLHNMLDLIETNIINTIKA